MFSPIAFLVLLLGAICGPGTLLRTLVIAIDMLLQAIGWNKPVSITLSSRAGLAARKGRPLAARIINLLFCNSKHCEEAIAADIRRAREALRILRRGE